MDELLKKFSGLLWPAIGLALIVLVGLLRAMLLLPAIRPRQSKTRARQQGAASVLIVLGSGGHTTEMFMLLNGLDTAIYSTRRYVIAEGDNHSIVRMQAFESRLEEYATARRLSYGSYDYKIVPRARKIHQSLVTTPWTAILTFIACLQVFKRSSKTNRAEPIYPDLILANGPATAFMLICAAFVLRYLRMPGTDHALRCIYVESWARLNRLSLTGKLLRFTGLCDRFLVQWPGLEVHNHRVKQLGEYRGPLVI